MRIGIDLDDTISATEEVMIEYALKYDKEYVNGVGIINHASYKYSGKFAWTEEQTSDFYKMYLEGMVKEYKPKHYSKEVINKLKEKGHEIYIITYRGYNYLSDPYALTKDWLDKYNIKYNKLIVNSGTKGIVCQENNVDLFFDDSVDHCLDVSNRGIQAYLFNAHHNQSEELPRVNNWLEIYKLIEGEEYDG